MCISSSSSPVSGRDAYVDIKVMRDMAGLVGLEASSDDILYILDVKGICAGRLCEKAVAPASNFSMAQVRQILAYVFGDPQRRANQPGVLKAGDVALFLEGRSVRAAVALTKELQKYTKSNPSLRQRAVAIVRLMYHNREFSANGSLAYRCERSGIHARLPEPLENLHCILHKGTTLQNRSRRFLDVPGDTRSRGIANLSMKTFQETAMGLATTVVAESICQDSAAWGGTTAGAAAADDAIDLDVDEQCLDENGVDGEEFNNDAGTTAAAAATAAAPSDQVGIPVKLFPWESPEVQHREWLNVFGHSKDDKPRRVVDFAIGTGTAAVAAARHNHKYLGLAVNPAHKDLALESVLLHILLDLILNRRDGFHLARFLSRARSVGGQDCPAEPQTTAAGTAPTEKGSKGAKPTGNPEESDSSSSSSSS